MTPTPENFYWTPFGFYSVRPPTRVELARQWAERKRVEGLFFWFGAEADWDLGPEVRP